MAEVTPMMRQYLTLKDRHPDCLLFFRLGDFYEMFQDDAMLVSRELELTLTTRDRGRPEEERTPMCGVPYHSAEAYIARLIAKGYKVAICEQMESPAEAKGLVERDVVRIVTPGTIIESSILEEGRNNFIAAVYRNADEAGAAFCDISTGECYATGAAGEDCIEHIASEVIRFTPREVVLSDGAFSTQGLARQLQAALDCRIEQGGETRFHTDRAEELAAKQFSAQVGNVEAGKTAALQAVGGLLDYLHETQKTNLSHISTLNYYTGEQFMALDLTARRNLELTETLRSQEKRGSLLWVLDRTKTAMGSRLLRAWTERPLLSPVAINRRLEAVGALASDMIARQEIALTLRGVTDLERLIARVVYGTAGGKDLAALSEGLGRLPALRALCAPLVSAELATLQGGLDDLPDLRDLIDRAIGDQPPHSVREGGFIRAGYDAGVDELRHIMAHGKEMLAAIESAERERTGIKSLKVGFNRVFGYYIEVSRSHYALVPEQYIRKQTLAGCERFITQELKDLEHKILSAQERVTALEYELFCALRERTADCAAAIQSSASAVARLDVLTSLATVAAEQNYCRPEVDLSDRLDITDGRHPVVEMTLKNSLFVPNDAHLNCRDDTVCIITGPNMAGKSTYMRQVALIALMAQMGSFVPAKHAHIGIIDRVFTRIGASDDLAAGQSTFMVEMTEVAQLLKHATARSLLILDEIGRGTSTYDGMSIARAVVEYCADKKRLGAKTLFATHYHELTVLEGQLTGVKNYNIAAKKRQGEIIFLRKIVRGGADESYGIEVAKLAGVPSYVIARAREILAELETVGQAPHHAAPAQESGQISMGDLGAEQVAARLRAVSPDVMSPREAQNLLYDLWQMLR